MCFFVWVTLCGCSCLCDVLSPCVSVFLVLSISICVCSSSCVFVCCVFFRCLFVSIVFCLMGVVSVVFVFRHLSWSCVFLFLSFFCVCSHGVSLLVVILLLSLYASYSSASCLAFFSHQSLLVFVWSSSSVFDWCSESVVRCWYDSCWFGCGVNFRSLIPSVCWLVCTISVSLSLFVCVSFLLCWFFLLLVMCFCPSWGLSRFSAVCLFDWACCFHVWNSCVLCSFLSQ